MGCDPDDPGGDHSSASMVPVSRLKHLLLGPDRTGAADDSPGGATGPPGSRDQGVVPLQTGGGGPTSPLAPSKRGLVRLLPGGRQGFEAHRAD